MAQPDTGANAGILLAVLRSRVPDVARLRRSPKMDRAIAVPSVKAQRVWTLWFSVAVQHLLFLMTYGLRMPLIGISEWVIFVPIVIIWVLYAAVPLLTPRREGRHALLRAYALTGWIFVAAALSWATSYIVLSEKFGTPVSYELMLQMQRKAEGEQATTGNDGKASLPSAEPEARRP